MAFCSFSKDYDDNSYVAVENKFITKYLPEADGFAVKVYLYGLYLCKNAASDFSLASMAEVLKADEKDIADAFALWEDYDLVAIVSKQPFCVQYLPVRSASGRPKRVRYEQYADFNKELQRKLGRVGKFLSAADYKKYMRFLEENAMQPQALLLIAEYCISKKGEAISAAYIFNKAKKLMGVGAVTYEQVERELSSFSASEGHLLDVFAALGGSNTTERVPSEAEFSLYRKWTETLKFDADGIVATAKCLKRGTMNALDMTLEDLYEHGVKDAAAITKFLTEREVMTNLAFRLGRKLGVKVSNPVPFVEEYVEKWLGRGFDDSALLDIALFCMKNGRGSFEDMDGVVARLAESGATEKESVKAFLKETNEDLKLFARIQEFCGTLRKNATNLALVKAWREWGFGEEMILEAAKRSAASASPLPYMNKILGEWKEAGIFSEKGLTDEAKKVRSGGAGMSSTGFGGAKNAYTNPSVDAANAKSERERYYALLREKAQTRADKYLALANANARFKELGIELSKMELALAKAEMFTPDELPALSEKKQAYLRERKSILEKLNIDEADLVPRFVCEKCSDTGFLKNGTACGCYKA